MSDLVKRLRFIGGNSDETANEAADEIERLTRERDEALADDYTGPPYAGISRRKAIEMHLLAERDLQREQDARHAAEAQVVALREALRMALDADAIAEWFMDTDADGLDVRALLTDTAAAARECERRLRVEGAEAERDAASAEGCHNLPDPAAVVDAATAAGKWGKP